MSDAQKCIISGGSSPYLVSGSSSVLSTREHPPFNQPASGCSSVLRNSEANHVVRYYGGHQQLATSDM